VHETRQRRFRLRNGGSKGRLFAEVANARRAARRSGEQDRSVLKEAGAGRQLLGTWSDAKLDTFNGGRAKFEQWGFLFESYPHLLGWGTFVENAMKL